MTLILAAYIQTLLWVMPECITIDQEELCKTKKSQVTCCHVPGYGTYKVKKKTCKEWKKYHVGITETKPLLDGRCIES